MAETDAQRFRQEAEECREMAANPFNPSDKEARLRLAAEWLKMAEEAERRRASILGT